MFGRKNKLIKKMLAAVDLVKMGLYARLKVKFLQQHDSDFSDLLAGAVINTLFARDPTTSEAEQFTSANRELIEQELRALAADPEVRDVITQAVRTRTILLMNDGDDSSVENLERLTSLGILLPGGPAPSLEFASLATRFYQSNMPRGET